MVNIKFGSEVFNDVDQIKIGKANGSGTVSFMPSEDIFRVMSGESPLNDIYENPYISVIGDVAIRLIGSFKTAYFANATSLARNDVGANRSGSKNFIAPKLTSIANYFTNNTNFEVLDFTDLTACGDFGLKGSKLTSIILRGNTVPTIGSVANQSTNKPTVYVPSSMLTAYNADTSWASLVSTKEWTITALEGSQYENTNWFRNL